MKTNKMLLWSLMVLLSATLFSCKGKKKIEMVLGQTTATMQVGDRFVVLVKTGNGTYEAGSSNNAVATVSVSRNDIVLQAVAEGTAVITVKDLLSKQRATIAVSVTKKTEGGSGGGGTIVTPVSGVTVSPATHILPVAATFTLTATVLPVDATNKAVSWSSDNTAVATVGATTGLVTAIAEGSAVMTATTSDGGKTATCTVTVKPAEPHITFTTNKAKGAIMILDFAVADEADKAGCWIDLNANGTRDAGEDIKSFTEYCNTGVGCYTVDAPHVTVYGKVTAFVAGYDVVAGDPVGAGITLLDISQNKGLENLEIHACNELRSADLTQNAALKVVIFSVCEQLAALNVTRLPNLVSLHLYGCHEISIIDVTKNKELTALTLAYTKVASLDISKNPALKYLRWDIRSSVNYASGAVSSVINNLPARAAADAAEICLKSGTTLTATEQAALTAKNWKLILL